MGQSYLIPTTFFCAFLALIFMIVALTTKEWIILNIYYVKIMSFGLWNYCIESKCYNDVATIPAVLSIIVTVLIFICLILIPFINSRKRFLSNILYILMIFFFISIILLLTAIVTFRPKLPQNFYKQVIDYIMGETRLNHWMLDYSKKYDRSNLEGSIFSAQNIDKWNLNRQTFNGFDSIVANHGFSSALLISALPLLIICLITTTYAAAFRRTEYITKVNHYSVDRVYL